MNSRVFVFVFLGLLVVSSVDAQRKKSRKGRKDACHLREIENCINKVQDLGKRKEPSVLIASDSGLNTICKTVKDDLSKCIKSYVKKCGTPLHREVIDLVIDQVTNQVGRFCDPANPDRKEFLKHSPCMHKKVLSTEVYKTTCNNNFLATVDQIDDGRVNADNTYNTICCGYKRWDSCTKKLITKECGKEGYESFTTFIGESFGTLTHMACPKSQFSTKTEVCKDLLPTEGVKAKGKLGDNALTKYVTSLFSFLFIIDN